MSLFLCLVGSLEDREFYVENHFNSEIRRLCSIVFSVCYWESRSHNSQPPGSFWDFLNFLIFFLKFHSFVLSFLFFFKLFVNTWWAFQCLETVWGIFLNDFFYDFINSFWNFLIKFSRGRFLYRSFKFLDFLFLLSISVIFLSWFWESSSTLLLDEFLYVFLFPLSYF